MRFEPTHALVAADHGLADIRKIVALAPTHLETGGSIALEHGYDQAQAVRNILEANGFTGIGTLKDLNQLDQGIAGHSVHIEDEDHSQSRLFTLDLSSWIAQVHKLKTAEKLCNSSP